MKENYILMIQCLKCLLVTVALRRLKTLTDSVRKFGKTRSRYVTKCEKRNRFKVETRHVFYAQQKCFMYKIFINPCAQIV